MNRPWLKHYEAHVPHSLTYPKIPIQRFLADTVDRHPDHVAITFNELHLTYRELNERVNRFAQALLKLGVEKGDRIAFLLVNSPTYVFAFFAVMKLGAVVVNLNVGIQGEELARCLKDSGAKAVVTLDLFAQGVYAVIRKTGVKTVILHSVFGLEKTLSLEQGVPQPLVFQDLLASAGTAEEPAVPVLPGDVAVLQYTSGSTGSPKPALLCHESILIQNIGLAVGFELGIADRMLINLPPSHVGCTTEQLGTTVYGGGVAVILHIFDPKLSLEAIQKHRVSVLGQIPALFNMEWRLPEYKTYDLSTLRFALYGGQAVSREFLVRMKEMAPRIGTGLGLTETAGFCTYTNVDAGVDERLHRSRRIVERLGSEQVAHEHGAQMMPGRHVQAVLRRPGQIEAHEGHNPGVGFFRCRPVAFQLDRGIAHIRRSA